MPIWYACNSMEAALVHQCRLCMEYDSFHMNIFREDLYHKQILMKLKTCLPVKVEHRDGLPSSICYKCLSQLEQSFDLWNKSFNSEAILRHNLARGRVQPILKNTSPLKDSVVSNTEFDSFDHDSYFIEIREPQDNVMGRKDIGEFISVRMKENIMHMSGKPTFSEHHENPNSRYMSNRHSSLVKKTPNGENKIPSQHGPVKYNDKSEKKMYSSMNQPKLKDKLDSGEKSQSRQKNYLKGSGTLGMDSEEFSSEESYMKNKYIHKNLFGDDEIKIYGKMKKPHRNAKRTPDMHARSDGKDKTSRKSKTHSWVKMDRQCEEEIMTIPGNECNLDSFIERKRAASKPKETHNDGGLQFDPYHCPKCNKTLTPSQNWLSHFQSHIQDD